jgi:glucokinase
MLSEVKDVVAGVDIGGTNTLIGLVDRSGTIVAENKICTASYPEIEDFISVLANSIQRLVSGDNNIRLVGIGIGAPDANYHRGTIELATNLAWKGVIPFTRLLTEKINLPVVITNDANAAAMGEMIFGGAKEMKDFVILTLGTGLGSGIVVNGELVYGHTGFAGELGHIIVVPGGRDCGCGRQGCLETYSSAPGLVRTVLYMLSEMNADSSLRNVAPSELTAKRIADEAENGDFIALEAFDYTAEMLALGIINAIVFSSPEAIFLFGGLTQAGDLLFNPVRKYVDLNIMPVFKGTVRILPSEIPENNAAVLGAAALAWKELSLSQA